VIAKALDGQDQTLEELTAYYGDQYATNLY
jgi:hypothetical protein